MGPLSHMRSGVDGNAVKWPIHVLYNTLCVVDGLGPLT